MVKEEQEVIENGHSDLPRGTLLPLWWWWRSQVSPAILISHSCHSKPEEERPVNYSTRIMRIMRLSPSRRPQRIIIISVFVEQIPPQKKRKIGAQSVAGLVVVEMVEVAYYK